MIPKSKIIIATLLLTNAFAGAMWWRSQQENRYWMSESRTLSKQYDIALKENESLQEAIVGQRNSSPKLSALNSTMLGKCVSKNPNNAQDRCFGSERVINGYQKLLRSPDNKHMLSSINQSLLWPSSSQAKKSLEEQ